MMSEVKRRLLVRLAMVRLDRPWSGGEGRKGSYTVLCAGNA